MTAARVLEQARAAGVELAATPTGDIRWRSTRPLSGTLRSDIVAHKAELALLLAAAPPERPCPSCGMPLDEKRRCWKCCDRICSGCERTTGSAFIELCLQCEAVYRKQALDRRAPGCSKEFLT